MQFSVIDRARTHFSQRMPCNRSHATLPASGYSLRTVARPRATAPGQRLRTVKFSEGEPPVAEVERAKDRRRVVLDSETTSAILERNPWLAGQLEGDDRQEGWRRAHYAVSGGRNVEQ